jgi:cell division protein ZapB
MSVELLQRLEEKIDNAVETIELLRLQIEELEDKHAKLNNENSSLKNKHISWEQNLTVMLEKLDTVEPESAEVKQKEAVIA